MEYDDKTYVLENAFLQPKPVLVVFYTAGELHSDEALRTIANIRPLIDAKVTLVLIDTTTNQDLAYKYGIRSVPTFIMFKDGKEALRKDEVLSGDDIEDLIKRFA